LKRARQAGRGRSASEPGEIPARGWSDILWRVFYSISDNRLVAMSGGVAFFALMAIFPAFATIVSLYGLFANAQTIIDHLSLLSGIFPESVLELFRQQVLLVAGKSNDTLGMAFLVGFLIALWSANSGMAALLDALNVVYGEREKRTLTRFYTTSLLFTLGSVLFVLAALCGVVVLPIALSLLRMDTIAEQFVSIARWPALLVVVGAALAAIYRFGPSRREARWGWVTWGSVMASLMWIGASMIFSWYVATFDSYNRIYGSLGAAVGFMTWIWISILVVLLGAEVNAEMEHQTACDTTEGAPKPLGRRGSIMADHVGAAASEL
jgi:membrane protein